MFGTIGVFAANVNARQIDYNDTTVDVVLDDLYNKANQEHSPIIYIGTSTRVTKGWSNTAFPDVLLNNNYLHHLDENNLVFDKDCKIKFSVYFGRTHVSIDYTPAYKLSLNNEEIISGDSPKANTTNFRFFKTVEVDVKKDDILSLQLYGGGNGAAVITLFMEVVE